MYVGIILSIYYSVYLFPSTALTLYLDVCEGDSSVL